jgi:hypothetical protein
VVVLGCSGKVGQLGHERFDVDQDVGRPDVPVEDMVSPQESKTLGGVSLGISCRLLIHCTFLYDARNENLDERCW